MGNRGNGLTTEFLERGPGCAVLPAKLGYWKIELTYVGIEWPYPLPTTVAIFSPLTPRFPSPGARD